MDEIEWIAVILASSLLIICIIEVGIIAYAFATANTVKCNWLFCEFINERKEVETIETHYCYMNGIPINCSD